MCIAHYRKLIFFVFANEFVFVFVIAFLLSQGLADCFEVDLGKLRVKQARTLQEINFFVFVVTFLLSQELGDCSEVDLSKLGFKQACTLREICICVFICLRLCKCICICI